MKTAIDHDYEPDPTEESENDFLDFLRNQSSAAIFGRSGGEAKPRPNGTQQRLTRSG
jgi:hypothetical protein